MTGVAVERDQSQDTLAAPEPQVDASRLRHPYESSRFALAMISSAVVGSVFVFVVLSVITIGGLLSWAFGVVGVVLVLWLALQLWRVRLLADGVKVDQRTTPALARIVQDVRERLGYTRRVDVFVVDRLARLIPGETRTTSLTSFFGVRVVLLEGGVVGDLDDDVARRRLTFVLATHIGALKARHAQWTTLLLVLDALRLNVIVWPLVTPWLRATVYTGDRIAYVCCGDLSISAQAAYRALVGGEAVTQLRRPGLVEQALAVRRSRILRLAQLLRGTPHVPNRYLELLAFASSHQPEVFEELRAEVHDPAGQLDRLLQHRWSTRTSRHRLMPVTVAISSLSLLTSAAAGLFWPAESVRWVATTAEVMGWPVDDEPTKQSAPPLAELLPVEVADACEAASEPAGFGTGVRAAYLCSFPAAGVELVYVQYGDAAATAAAFAAEATAVPSIGACSQGRPARSSWSDRGRAVGELACFNAPDGSSVLVWSTTEHHTLAYAVSDRDLEQHYAWWLTLPELR